jgi:hypothetical protein
LIIAILLRPIPLDFKFGAPRRSSRQLCLGIEPAHFRHLTIVLLPHDYLNLWLTGERQMEYGDASGTGLLDVRTRQWSKPILKIIDPKLETMRAAERTLRFLPGTAPPADRSHKKTGNRRIPLKSPIGA